MSLELIKERILHYESINTIFLFAILVIFIFLW